MPSVSQYIFCWYCHFCCGVTLNLHIKSETSVVALQAGHCVSSQCLAENILHSTKTFYTHHRNYQFVSANRGYVQICKFHLLRLSNFIPINISTICIILCKCWNFKIKFSSGLCLNHAVIKVWLVSGTKPLGYRVRKRLCLNVPTSWGFFTLRRLQNALTSGLALTKLKRRLEHLAWQPSCLDITPPPFPPYTPYACNQCRNVCRNM